MKNIKHILCIIGLSVLNAHSISTKITKVVVPAAGIGSRFLPITKAIPKEMIPLSEKPAMHIIAEEAQAAGIDQLVVIISDDKQALQDYFDPTKSDRIKQLGKYHMVAHHEQALQDLAFSYILQEIPKGLGHAVKLAQDHIGNDYFGVMLPDDIVFSDIPAIGQLIEIAEREQATVIAVQEVPMEMVHKYGVISIAQQLDENTFEVADLVEKPAREKAPSNLAIIGRYVLSPKIFDSLQYLEDNNILTKNELQLTDAIADLLRKGEKIIAYKVQGERHDTGMPLGWMKAVIANGLRDTRYHDQLVAFMQKKLLQE